MAQKNRNYQEKIKDALSSLENHGYNLSREELHLRVFDYVDSKLEEDKQPRTQKALERCVYEELARIQTEVNKRLEETRTTKVLFSYRPDGEERLKVIGVKRAGFELVRAGI